MKFKRIELGVKIGSLADEAKRIRNKEISLLLKAQRRRVFSLLRHKDQWKPENGTVSPELQEELKRRINPFLEKNKDGDLWKMGDSIDRIGRKVVRKFARMGMTKEEILAVPGVQASLRAIPMAKSLQDHRKGPVRHEARHAQLALGFLRQRPYEKTEDKPTSYPAWEKVASIAQRFSLEDSRIVAQRFEQWRQEAVSYIRGRELMTKAHYRTEPDRIG